MEEHVLIAVGKVAGIGGLALGVFLLLFREVIRKKIFPTLPHLEAYRLIRQFMFLTFGLALFGLGSWTYISVIATPRSDSHSKPKRLAPFADISGTWIGDVKYNWGDTYHEEFVFDVAGHEVSGSATYVTAPHVLSEGIVDGKRVNFRTVSFTEVNGQRYKEKHLYKGTINEDTIDFVLETDSDYDAPPPVKFTVHKK
jgi:hypothetical protein